MYIKLIKKGYKEYKYYYHNIKINGKVKNICLGSSKKEALAKLKKIKKNGFHDLVIAPDLRSGVSSETRGFKPHKLRVPTQASKLKSDFQKLLANAPTPAYPNSFTKSDLIKIFLEEIILILVYL